MIRLCLDLNVWCAAFLSRRMARSDTAAGALMEAVRSGRSPAGPVSLVVSWGMLERLQLVLVRDLDFTARDAEGLCALIGSYARQGPSLTVGGIGVIALHDTEDRHVLETAWAGEADLLVTANLADFIQTADDVLTPGRVYRLSRGARSMILAHPFDAAARLRGQPPQTW